MQRVLFERQKRIARANPCFLSMETQDPAFIWEQDNWRCILTVDAGYQCIEQHYGGPVWHLSVSYQGSLVFSPHEHIQRCVEYAHAMMEGTGDGRLGEWTQYWCFGEVSHALHVRRRMTPTEQRGIAMRDVRGTHEATVRARHARKVAAPDWDESFIH